MSELYSSIKSFSNLELMKQNKAIASVSFSIKELFEYITAKASDGAKVFNLHLMKEKTHMLSTRIEKLKSIPI